MNHWSSGHLVPLPVYTGFFFSCLRGDVQNSCLRYPGGHSRLVGLRAVRNVGTLFFPVSPCLAFRGAQRRPNPPFVCPGFGFDRLNNLPLFINPFSCEACTEICGGTLVSSQEQSALAVRVVKQLPTACQTSISFLHFFSFPYMPCMKRVYKDK